MKTNLKKIAIAFALTLCFSTAVFAECFRDGGFVPDGTMIAHTEIYSKFFVCSDGWWIEKECALGLWFNPTTGMCDFPFNVPNPGGQ
jgi:hypothetical protein